MKTDKGLRVLHGPNNITGTPKKLSELERRKGFTSLSVNTSVNKIDGPSHINSRNRLISKIIFRMKYFFQALLFYDVLNFHAGASFFPLNLDLPFYKIFRKRIIMHYYGSEVRTNKRLLKVNPYAKYLEKDGKNSKGLDFVKEARVAWHSVWIDYAVAPRDTCYFVSHLISRSKVKESIWTANILSPEALKLTKNHIEDQKEIPTIIHCPTNKITKGTKFVEKVVKNLKSKGFKFEFHTFENMDQLELQKYILEEVDIVLDQFLVGSFGNLAIESMAFGKVVMCYLNKDLCLQFCKDCPIINTSIETLEEKLANLITNFQERKTIASKGPKYTDEYVKPESVIENLIKLYT